MSLLLYDLKLIRLECEYHPMYGEMVYIFELLINYLRNDRKQYEIKDDLLKQKFESELEFW